MWQIYVTNLKSLQNLHGQILYSHKNVQIVLIAIEMGGFCIQNFSSKRKHDLYTEGGTGILGLFIRNAFGHLDNKKVISISIHH